MIFFTTIYDINIRESIYDYKIKWYICVFVPISKFKDKKLQDFLAAILNFSRHFEKSIIWGGLQAYIVEVTYLYLKLSSISKQC